MSVKQGRTIEIFCSYDHEDELLWKKLEKQLHFLERNGLISAWHRQATQAGQEWQLEADEHLRTSHIILLLISPAFMASDRCYNIEMREAMRRLEAGEVHVIPIILRPVIWDDEPFSKLQVLPKGGKPVKSWSNSDEAFLDIARGIQKIVKEILIERFLAEADKLEKDRQHEDALAAFEKAMHFGFNTASAFQRKGNVLLNSQRYEQALAAYQEALHLNPNIRDPYFYQNIGHTLRNLKRFEEALAAYEQAIRLSMPNPDPRLYHDKGDVLERLAQQAYELAKQYSQGASHGTVSY